MISCAGPSLDCCVGQSHLPHCTVLPLGEFNGMSSKSHISHCIVLPLGEFTVMIPDWATCHIAGCSHLAKSMSWSCHNQGVMIPSSILKIVFRHILFNFFTAVWALTSSGFRIVFDTFVYKVQWRRRRHLLIRKAAITLQNVRVERHIRQLPYVNIYFANNVRILVAVTSRWRWTANCLIHDTWST